jgi:hypothetical protein
MQTVIIDGETLTVETNDTNSEAVELFSTKGKIHIYVELDDVEIYDKATGDKLHPKE